MRAVTSQDIEWLVALKESAMRPDLERLGVWDPDRSRRRLLEELAPASTWRVLAGKQAVSLKPRQPATTELVERDGDYFEPGVRRDSEQRTGGWFCSGDDHKASSVTPPTRLACGRTAVGRLLLRCR
jgi:hypothetical protein